MRRLGIVVVVALVAHVWMLPATGAPTVPSAMGHAHAPTAAPSAVPDPGHCPFGMAACVVQLPPETGDDLLRAMLLATAVIPLAARRRAARTTRPSPRPPALPRPAVPASVVLLE